MCVGGVSRKGKDLYSETLITHNNPGGNYLGAIVRVVPCLDENCVVEVGPW